SIDEVHDACGNIANYSSNSEEGGRQVAKSSPQMRQFSVHERPRISLSGCSPQIYLQAAKDDSIELPIHFHGRAQGADAPYTLTYSFSGPTSESDLSTPPKLHQVSLKNVDDKPRIKVTCCYSLNAVSSQLCTG